ARVRSGWRVVELDAGACTLRVPAGVSLDVGATAKAWVADRGAWAGATAGACGALVSVGGDIGTAGEAPAGGWRVHVTDDHRSAPSAPGQTVGIGSGGLATSSTAVRRWSARGQSMHHIIDPATGAPARSCWRTVSVAAADCAQANIAPTAAIGRGAPAVPRVWCGAPGRAVSRTARAPRSAGIHARTRDARSGLAAGRGEGGGVNVLAAAGPSVYWYLTRSTGAVSLLLLTL